MGDEPPEEETQHHDLDRTEQGYEYYSSSLPGYRFIYDEGEDAKAER